MNAVGVDAGTTAGAIVCISPSNEIRYWDMPAIKAKGESSRTDYCQLAAILQDIGSGVAVVESVHIDQRDLAKLTSAETMVRNHEAVITLLTVCGFGIIELAPVQWRGKLKLEKGLDKSGLVSEAIQLYPQCRGWLKYPHRKRMTLKEGRAEALLMAHLARQLMEEVQAA